MGFLSSCLQENFCVWEARSPHVHPAPTAASLTCSACDWLPISGALCETFVLSGICREEFSDVVLVLRQCGILSPVVSCELLQQVSNARPCRALPFTANPSAHFFYISSWCPAQCGGLWRPLKGQPCILETLDYIQPLFTSNRVWRTHFSSQTYDGQLTTTCDTSPQGSNILWPLRISTFTCT